MKSIVNSLVKFYHKQNNITVLLYCTGKNISFAVAHYVFCESNSLLICYSFHTVTKNNATKHDNYVAALFPMLVKWVVSQVTWPVWGYYRLLAVDVVCHNLSIWPEVTFTVQKAMLKRKKMSLKKKEEKSKKLKREIKHWYLIKSLKSYIDTNQGRILHACKACIACLVI